MAASKMLVWEDPRRIDKAGHLIFPDGQNRGRGSGALDTGQFDREEEVLWPDGCAAMYRKEMLDRIGGFDEDFFAYGDDAELGLRARIAGWRCIYTPEAVVRHHRGVDPGQGLGAAAGADRAQPPAAGAEAVSLEPAVAEPVLLRRAGGRGAPGGAPRRGRYRAFSGRARQMAHGARAPVAAICERCAWPRACCASAPADPPHSPALAGRGAPADSGQPPEPEGNRMSACLACGCGRAAPLFRQTDRLYRTTTREFARGALRQCGLARLDPQPSPEELRRYYPETYWFAPDGGAASRLEESYRRAGAARPRAFRGTGPRQLCARAARCSTWVPAAGCFWE